MKKTITYILLGLVLIASVYSATRIVRRGIIYENISVPIIELIPIYHNVSAGYTLVENESVWREAYTYRTYIRKRTGTKYRQGRRIGVQVNDRDYIGNFNVEDNRLMEWSVDIGDRNFEEYGRCRQYEIAKGVCKETRI